MKLIIQIPCYNESKTLPITLNALPKKVEGFDEIELLVINDGSSDDTVKIAKDHGVNHILNFKKSGLAKAFLYGIKRCVQLGADVIVNTDADNQYNAEDIPKLVKPILEGKADYVVGERPISKTAHFSLVKKILQKLGSWVVQKASSTKIPDAPSGFRAMSRECALELNVYNEYTYTLETIIQAGQKNMAICSVPIRTNEDLRPSRLFSSMTSYIKKSIVTILRIFIIYRPFRFFMTIAIILFSFGFLLGLRFLYFYLIGEGNGHTQSIVLASILLITGFQTGLIAFIADLLAVNRKVIEEIQKKIDNKK